MNTNTVTKMAVKYDCIHEDLIQAHSTDIQSLKTRADYKDKRLDALDSKIEKMSEKLDRMNDSINKLILQSNKNDADLEKRLVAATMPVKKAVASSFSIFALPFIL